jgi:hypothetical protein
MKKFVLAVLLISLTSTGFAIAEDCGQTIYELQTNSPAYVGTLVTPCNVVVTAVRYNGFFVQEAPHGQYNGIWVYTGSAPDVVEGDVVYICGEHKEYFDFTEIDVAAAGLYGYVLKVGTAPVPAPNFVTAADLMADGEPWESVMITIVDGMEVPAGFDLGFGEWAVNALDGTALIFDDYWYDFAQVMEGQCYNNATGILIYSFGAFKLEPFADGIPIVNCAVGTEDVSLGTVKALFR